MKRFFHLLVFMLLLAAVPAQAAEQSSVITKEFNLKDFQGLSAGSLFQVTLVQDDQYKVTVEYSDYLEKYLRVHVTDNTLHLKLDNLPASIQRARKFQDSGVLRATVHMPVLAMLELSGAAKLSARGQFKVAGTYRMDLSGATSAKDLSVQGRRARIEISGAAKCERFEGRFDEVLLEGSGASRADFTVDAAAWDIEFSGAVQADLKGQRSREIKMDVSGAVKTKLLIPAGYLSYEGSGASSLQATEVSAHHAVVELSGTAKCQVAVEEALEIEASGVAECRYKAAKDAKVRVVRSGRMAKIEAM